VVMPQTGDIDWWLCHRMGIWTGGYATDWGYRLVVMPQCGQKQVVLQRKRDVNWWLCHTVRIGTGG